MDAVLPGEDLIEAGLQDLRDGHETIAALLVTTGAPRLKCLGLELPDHLPANPEHRLYDLLAETDQDSTHSRYNAFIKKTSQLRTSRRRAGEQLAQMSRSC